MNKYTKIIFTMVFCFFAFSAKAGDAYGPMGKRFGLGIVLGDPTGVTAKGYVNQRFAVSGIASWSFIDESLVFILDGTYEVLDLNINSDVNRTVDLPLYLGLGGKIGLDDNSNTDTEFVIRVPVGVAAQWRGAPFEVFVELAPGMQLSPETEFDLTGGIGARFYF